MKNKQLHLYSIMPLDTEHLEEICEDIRLQYETGVATCALFSMTLVPEGNPPVDKATLLCEKYDRFRERLRSMGIGSGVLVQASIGHGWTLSERFPYQGYENLTDGAQTNTVCPADEGFRTYIRNAMTTIAAHKPDCIMVDDDFRLLFRLGGGCACPLHLERFARLAGTSVTREELLETVRSDSPHAKQWSDWFVQTQKDSLLECAKEMRKGIDRIDPTLPGSFCCVGNSVEFGAEIAEILAGQGNPVVIRINNANYTPFGAKEFSRSFLKAASQFAKLKGHADIVLAETDTCPQNRYSTGARSLHTHFTGSILEGANGAKHWITRLAAHELESGTAYRKILAAHRGFYQTLSEIVPTLRWHGFRIPVCDTPRFFVGEPWTQSRDGTDAWSRCVLERLGLPLYFSAEPGGVVCMEGNADSCFDDDRIREMLRGNLLLASDSATHLIARGFGRYLGADVREWHGKQPTHEVLSVNGNSCKIQLQIRELVPTSDKTREDSTVFHSVDGVRFERLFPGSTVFQNELGGQIFLFSGTPNARFDITEAFSFLNSSRKRQLTRLLKDAGELPVYYPGDEEVYFRAADMKDGSLFCALFNLSCDPIEETQLVCDRTVHTIERLMPDGTWQRQSFRPEEGQIYTVDVCCEHLNPILLRLS